LGREPTAQPSHFGIVVITLFKTWSKGLAELHLTLQLDHHLVIDEKRKKFSPPSNYNTQLLLFIALILFSSLRVILAPAEINRNKTSDPPDYRNQPNTTTNLKNVILRPRHIR
jgi:hypothetical protein